MNDTATPVEPPDAPATTPARPPLQLNARLKPELFAAVFAKFGRIHIPAILEKASAQALYAAMTSGDVPWQMHYNDGPASYDIPAVQVDALTELEQLALRKPIWSRAQSAFQYCFDNFSLADHHARGEYLGLGLMQAFDLMRSPAMLEFARRVTGVREISSVDAQATRYRRGDFLTSHDDRDEDKGRVAAYVLNMTPQWRSDWGGLLQFLDEDGHVAEAYAPAFNALNILRVPQSHSVSIVAPFAGQPRLSITGWFRR